MPVEARIEVIMNMAHYTLGNLPKRGEYDSERLTAALNAVSAWAGKEQLSGLARTMASAEYICHLADVIDIMESALTATLQELRECQSRETATRAERAGVIMDSMMGM